MAFEIDMLACAAEEDRRAKRDELMQREEARLAAVAVFEARLGKYDRLLDGLSYRDHDEQVMAALMDGRAAAIRRKTRGNRSRVRTRKRAALD